MVVHDAAVVGGSFLQHSPPSLPTRWPSRLSHHDGGRKGAERPLRRQLMRQTARKVEKRETEERNAHGGEGREGTSMRSEERRRVADEVVICTGRAVDAGRMCQQRSGATRSRSRPPSSTCQPSSLHRRCPGHCAAMEGESRSCCDGRSHGRPSTRCPATNAAVVVEMRRNWGDWNKRLGTPVCPPPQKKTLLDDRRTLPDDPVSPSLAHPPPLCSPSPHP